MEIVIIKQLPTHKNECLATYKAYENQCLLNHVTIDRHINCANILYF